MTATQDRRIKERSQAFDRTVNMVLGAWLFVSAFAWHHALVSSINTALCGALVVVFAATGLRIPPMRWLNTSVGVWVVIAGALLPHTSVGTIWNNILVGLLIVLVSVGGLSRPAVQNLLP